MYCDNNPPGLGEDQSGARDTNEINTFRNLGMDIVVIRPALPTGAKFLSISEAWWALMGLLYQRSSHILHPPWNALLFLYRKGWHQRFFSRTYSTGITYDQERFLSASE